MASPSPRRRTNIKYKMIFSADGKMNASRMRRWWFKRRRHLELTKEGFCTTWKGSQPNCFRILTAGDNKWSVVKGTTVVATWTK